jgi:Protein of unknown function (DUF2569)
MKKGACEVMERNEKELVGIGGWLILIAIGQIVGPLRLLASLAQYYSGFDSRLWTSFPLVFYSEAVLNILLLAITLSTTLLFFTKSRQFPTFFILQYGLAILSFPLDAIITGVGLSMYTGKPISTFTQQILDPKQMGQWGVIVIYAMIWIPYIRVSKRVANTFCPQESAHPDAPYGDWSQADDEKFKRLLADRR